jgi:hypothetical protein
MVWCTGMNGVTKCGGTPHANNYYTCALCRPPAPPPKPAKTAATPPVSAALYFAGVGTAFN